ncbi:MAG TPA: carboxypeptidase-like regulatory domain-containing protein [Bacteroidales bacterium]|nr:carboxypeptidase-like regulatory domain-containing protein [Bacteroidales bacterium]
MSRLFYIAILLTIPLLLTQSQTSEIKKFVQLSGIITDDSNMPVQGVTVISKKLRRGTVSERTGIYSITSTPGDTIFFRALGFKRYHTIIPASYEERHCMVDIELETDTIPIKEITILPWKSYNDFIREITQERPVDPIIENMNENIASIYVAVANQTGLKVSPEAGYRYAMEQNFSAMSTKNQYPVNNLLNPFAWAKFINGVKNGLFKNQKFDKPVKAKVRKKRKKTEKK